MEYQALARKWRPQHFQDMFGQDHVKRALQNSLEQKRLHHAYLFTGTRGVGKTTVARLFAKSLNCQEGVSAMPCGQCEPCLSIQEGCFVDVIEVDAASRTKVEDTRELLENVQYAPTQGRYKIYLIDEVHMLSTHSFNALLKTLEEPPEHVKFLLATTDPQKLPITILSRCLQFVLKNLVPEVIVERLAEILKQEQFHFEHEALWQIAKAAKGSMRDALSLTDQGLAFGNQQLLTQEVAMMLGHVSGRFIFELLEHLASAKLNQAMQLVNQLSQQNLDFSMLMDELMLLLHRVAMAQMQVATTNNLLGDQAQIQSLARQLSAESVHLFYQILALGKKELPYAPEARTGFEMTLLRLFAMQPMTPVVQDSSNEQGVLSAMQPQQEQGQAGQKTEDKKKGSLGKQDTSSIKPRPNLSRLASDEDLSHRPSSALEHAQQPVAQLTQAIESQPQPIEQRSKAEIIACSHTEQRRSNLTREHSNKGGAQENDRALQVAPGLVEQPEALPAAAALLSDLNQENWLSVVSSLSITGPTANLLRHCAWVSSQQHSLELALSSEVSGMMTAQQQGKIQDVLSEYFHQKLTVSIALGLPQGAKTLSEHLKQIRVFGHQQALQAIAQDPVIQQMQSQYQATIIPNSVKPLSPNSQ